MTTRRSTRRGILEPVGRAAIEAAMRRRPLIAFDFDGTLAPIVPRPTDAHLPLGVARRLERLARLLPVAIVSGRATADLRTRLGFEPYAVIGNHGAEDDTAAAPPSWPALDRLRESLRNGAQRLAQVGVRVEDKGASVALHYRLAPDRLAALECIRTFIEPPDPGLRRFGGKCVVNLMPVDAPDKADAVLALLARSGRDALVFAGDDDNDEPVFERAAPGWLTIRVGRDAHATRAKYFLDRQADVVHLLDAMLAALESAPAQET